MKTAHKVLALGWLTAAAMGFAGAARAQVYTEPGDVGQTLATAGATGNPGTALSTIAGTLNSPSDADLYLLTITTPGAFSASTVNAVTNLSTLDTALFLFDASGNAIATNDDASGTTLASALPVGNALYATLGVGTYYLGISSSGNEPVNSAGDLLFAGIPGGDTTAVRGAAGSINPTTESDFNGNETDTTTSGAYEIDLTGVTAVPEPTTWAMCIAGSLAAAVTLLRRCRLAA